MLAFDGATPDEEVCQAKHEEIKGDKVAFTYISNVDFCLTLKSASVNSRSNFAFVLETETRMPVSML